MYFLPMRLLLNIRILNFLATKHNINSTCNFKQCVSEDEEFEHLCKIYNFPDDLNCYTKKMQLYFFDYIESLN